MMVGIEILSQQLPVKSASDPGRPAVADGPPVAADYATPAAAVPLTALADGELAAVATVAGTDLLAQRLAALGLWPGAVVERLAAAPFGDPLLFRLHGYRLALRRSEAARVQVCRCQGEA